MTTVTAQVAVYPPSLVVAVIVAVPAATPVTTPFATVATPELFVLQVIPVLEAFAGKIVAVRVFLAPLFMLAELELRLTPVTLVRTDTGHVAVFVFPKASVAE